MNQAGVMTPQQQLGGKACNELTRYIQTNGISDKEEITRQLSQLGQSSGWTIGQAAEAGVKKTTFRSQHPRGWIAAKQEKKSQSDEVTTGYQSDSEIQHAYTQNFRMRKELQTADTYSKLPLQVSVEHVLQEVQELADAYNE